jgi:hypothetical protein
VQCSSAPLLWRDQTDRMMGAYWLGTCFPRLWIAIVFALAGTTPGMTRGMMLMISEGLLY